MEVKGEDLKTDSKTKKVFFYVDTVGKINQISREVFKTKDEEIHYPRGFEGGQKYTNIKTFLYRGFKGKLPVGAIKSVNFGWGFTKTLNPFAYYVDETFKIKEVIIQKGGKVVLDTKKKILYLNEISLATLQDTFSSIFKKNKADVNHVLLTILHSLFPKEAKKPTKTYVTDALASSINSWGNSIDEFSEADKKAIKELFDKLSIKTSFLTDTALAKTKEIIDNKYIQETLKKYKSLMKAKKESSAVEKKWQRFLKENSWIFSSIFAQPVILYKDEAYVGGKGIDNKNGKFSDFLIKNSLSENVSFLEIKTHKTKLLESTAYRGEDVFSATKELTGCVVQVLNQRDNFQKEFYKNKAKSKDNIETFNSKCVVLIGSTKDLGDKQKYSFELFRSNSRDVEILTFDELEKKIESLQKILTTK
jgi:hypothetical protein